MTMECTHESHEASKLDENAWRRHRPWLPFHDGQQWLEVRHCACGSTLTRPYEGLRIRADATRATVSLLARVSGTASKHEWSNMAPRLFVHGEASDPIEAAAMALIAATELARAEGGK